ncbi:MAG: BON domain-containing protein [Pirellulaceae bacterium]
MKKILFGMLCVLAVGCSDANRSASDTQSRTQGATTITTKRPLTDSTNGTAGSTDPDNTGINVRDRDDSTMTPLDQNENRTDIDMTATIRKRIVETDMSIDAQNVKIVTQNGRVTLRGPVHTEQEKQRIEAIAKDVAGPDNVDNQLEVNVE